VRVLLVAGVGAGVPAGQEPSAADTDPSSSSARATSRALIPATLAPTAVALSLFVISGGVIVWSRKRRAPAPTVRRPASNQGDAPTAAERRAATFELLVRLEKDQEGAASQAGEYLARRRELISELVLLDRELDTSHTSATRASGNR
jgi:hypothetical protein